MNIIVIGGRGFIGTAFVRHLQQAGHSVTIVTRSFRGAVDKTETLFGGIDALISRPKIFASTDLVCHFASGTIPSSSAGAPLSDIESNLIPTLRLLNAMKECGNRRLLFLSSGGAIYGPPKIVPIPEDHPRNPISHYGLGKLAIENYLDYYAREESFKISIVRPANPYGAGQSKIGQLGAVSTFLRMIANDDTATLFGDGRIVRDFVHIDDLCDLMMRITNQDAVGIWNCGGGVGTSLRQLIELIERATGKTLKVNQRPSRPFDPEEVVLDIKKAKAELGWTPKIPLVDGILGMIAH